VFSPLPAIADILFGTRTDIGDLLFVTSVLLWLGYVGLRLSGRFRVPVVTTFLLLGVAAGPSGLNLISASMLDSLRFIEPVALGLITFSAGEQLLVGDVLKLSRRSFLAVGLETVLPILLVGTAVYLLTGEAVTALLLGAIAGTTGIATVMATLREQGARGSFTRLISVAVATDNFLAILLFSLILPLAVALTQEGGVLSLYASSLLGIAASILVGSLAGLQLGRLIRTIKSPSELSMMVLAHLLLAIGFAYMLGYSVLLTGLTMGVVAVNLSGSGRERERLFTSLKPLEDPIISFFFLWAGAGLNLRALAEVGLLALVYMLARLAGKGFGPLLSVFRVTDPQGQEATQLRVLGVALVPQAGATIGLAILAADTLPALGQDVLTVVLAAVVLFELTGPLAVQRAVKRVGEANAPPADLPFTLDEAIRTLEESKGVLMVATDRGTTLWQLASAVALSGRLQAELLVVPTEAPPDVPASIDYEAALLDRSPVELLDEHLDFHEHRVSVQPEISGDVVDDLLKRTADSGADLLILAWGPHQRRRFAPRVVELSAIPVVELPGPRVPQRRGLEKVAEGAGRLAAASARRVFRRLRGGRSGLSRRLGCAAGPEGGSAAG